MDKIEIKAALTVSDAGEITGIAWPFGSADRVGDIISPGAFNVAVSDLPILLAHDPEQPIGLWESVTETKTGLEVKGRLFVGESRRAVAVRSMMQSGLISGLSIGFRTQASSKRGSNRIISKLDLFEISVVRDPSHPRARITSAKNATAALAEAITRAAVALRTIQRN
ncbi:MAG: HK97 family phage prohead protease [Allorhizobium sp.]